MTLESGRSRIARLVLRSRAMRLRARCWWSPHELRRSAASLLLGQNIPLEVVSETLGHSSIRITADIYGHLVEPARQEAAHTMDRALTSDIEVASEGLVGISA